MIAVTGATGGVGGRVARALVERVPPSDTVERLREHPETMAHLRR